MNSRLVVLLRGLLERFSAADPPIALDLSPADGRADIQGLPAVQGEANAEDPRFRRFRCLGPEVIGTGGWAADSRGRQRRTQPPLLGRALICSLFVGHDGERWTDAEIARALGALERVAVWIETQASLYQARVNIDLAETYLQAEDDHVEPVELDYVPQGEEVGPLEAHAMRHCLASASRAASRLGFPDIAELVRNVPRGAMADQVIWILHPRQSGRSLAIPEEDSGVPGVNLAVCYARESSFRDVLTGPVYPDPVTLAHEMLHLFGASDKYGIPLSRFPRGEVTERDIMRLDENRLSRLRVGRLTAREIGWEARP